MNATYQKKELRNAEFEDHCRDDYYLIAIESFRLFGTIIMSVGVIIKTRV